MIPTQRAHRTSRLLLTVVLLGLLGPIGAIPATATVSGQDGKIAFVTDRDGNLEIYVMGSDGSGLVNLTNHRASDRDPTWSPDGRQIAFVSDRGGGDGIYVMDSDGSSQRFLVSGANPGWSPDGTRIAFSRGGIFVLDPSSGLLQITDPKRVVPPVGVTSVLDTEPTWSPDGSMLVFVRNYQTFTPTGWFSELLVISSEGTSAPILLPSTDWGLVDPDWSPDGSNILVTEVGTHGVGSQVVLVRPDGSHRVPLAVLKDLYRASVSWSPGGTRLVASAGTSTSSPDISVMNLDGSNPINLTNHPASDFDQAWQPLNPYPAGLVDPTTGIWYLRHADARITSFYYGVPGDVPFMGDWNCDGVETPGLYRQSDGFVYLRNTNSQGIADVRFFFGNPGDIPLAGDFDGDGCDTVSIYRPSEAQIYVINQLGSDDAGLGAAEYSYLFGDTGDKPFVGDFDGDGIDTVGLHRESTGIVYYRDSTTQGIADNTLIYGDPGDRLVAHDWNGDGSESPAVFRPGSKTFYFRFTNSTGIADARYIWGNSDWLPVAGAFEDAVSPAHQSHRGY
jgi:WD40-like Beta Propeller Repeat